MKPASIIFLIVAVVVFFGGFILCKVAASDAEKQGISLYTAEAVDSEEGAVRTYDFTDSDADKLLLDFKQTPVTIRTSENGKSYIDLVNFDSGAFDRNETNNVLTFSNNSRFFALFDNLKNGNLTFKGLRDLLAYQSVTDDNRCVNVYIAPDSELRNINVVCEDALLEIEDVAVNADFHFNMKGGDVHINGLSTDSLLELNVTGGKCQINDSSVGIGSFNVSGGIASSGFSCQRLTAESSGDVTVDFSVSHDPFWLDLKAIGGQILVDGKEMGSEYSEIPDEYEEYLEHLTEEEDTTDAESGGEAETEQTEENEFIPLDILKIQTKNGNISLSFTESKAESK